MDAVAGVVYLILGTALGWFARPYLVMRSEEHAKYDSIVDNLDVIRAKVETTERAAAQIKEDVAHSKWWEREDRVLRRNKLEEILLAAVECLHVGLRLTGSDADTVNQFKVAGPWFRVYVIARLYFPPLYPIADRIRSAGLELVKVALESLGNETFNKEKPDYKTKAHEITARLAGKVGTITELVSVLEAQVVEIMAATLAKPDDSAKSL
jgi:hypothetical protein